MIGTFMQLTDNFQVSVTLFILCISRVSAGENAKKMKNEHEDKKE